MHVYMAVTPNKLDLPIAIDDTAKKLSETLKIKEDTIYTGISRNRSGIIIGMKFIKVNITDEGAEQWQN